MKSTTMYWKSREIDQSTNRLRKPFEETYEEEKNLVMFDGSDQTHKGNHQEENSACHDSADDRQTSDNASRLCVCRYTNQDESNNLRKTIITIPPNGENCGVLTMYKMLSTVSALFEHWNPPHILAEVCLLY